MLLFDSRLDHQPINRNTHVPSLYKDDATQIPSKTAESRAYWSYVTVGILRNCDGDFNGNIKKAIGLMSKTTILHVHHAFLYISLQPRPQGFSLKKWEKPWGRG